jgi:hypothetical protein
VTSARILLGQAPGVGRDERGRGLSGYGILFRGVHQAVQGTALGVAVIFGIGETTPLYAREPAILQSAPHPVLRQSTAMARVLVLSEGPPRDRDLPVTATMARTAGSDGPFAAVPIVSETGKTDWPVARPVAEQDAQLRAAPVVDWDAPLPSPLAATPKADAVDTASPPASAPEASHAVAAHRPFPAFVADVSAAHWFDDRGAQRQSLIARSADGSESGQWGCHDCRDAGGKAASRKRPPLAIPSAGGVASAKATKRSRAPRAAAKSVPVRLEPLFSARFPPSAPITTFDAPALPTDMVHLACVVAAQNRMGPPCFAVGGAIRTSRKARAAMSRFPAFDPDVSTAPWLGDPGSRRAALAMRPDASKLGEPAGDREGAGEGDAEAVPDIATGIDGADGQANETDLLAIKTLPRGGLAFSGGYSSLEGPIGTVKIARTNIGAPGRDITASVRYSKIQRLAEFGVADANFMGSKLSVAPTFFYSRSTAVGFDEQEKSSVFRQTARGVNLYLGKPIGRGLRVAANYRYSDEDFLIRQKNAQCDVGLHGSPFCNALGQSTSSVVSVSLSLDRRNSTVDPTRGFQLRVTQDLAGPGGTTRYARTRVGGTFHHRLSGNFDVSLGVEGGLMKPIGGREIPLFDRFYIGGNSMRGFDLRGIGPKVVPLTAPAGLTTAVGGRAYYVGRLEVSFRLEGAMDRFGVSPSLFVDAGSVFGASKAELLPGERLIGNSAKPRVAVGLGLAFNAGPGKLRFNLAKPVVRQEGDRSKTFSIALGTAF